MRNAFKAEPIYRARETDGATRATEVVSTAAECLLTVEEIATRLRVNSSWVYRHATDLGAIRLGKYLRFSWTRTMQYLERVPLTNDEN